MGPRKQGPSTSALSPWLSHFFSASSFPCLGNGVNPCLATITGLCNVPGKLGAGAHTWPHPVPCPQHVVFAISHVLDLLVPDIPESVEVKVKREYYLAKQALAENEVSPPQPSLHSPSPMGGGPQPGALLQR